MNNKNKGMFLLLGVIIITILLLIFANDQNTSLSEYKKIPLNLKIIEENNLVMISPNEETNLNISSILLSGAIIGDGKVRILVENSNGDQLEIYNGEAKKEHPLITGLAVSDSKKEKKEKKDKEEEDEEDDDQEEDNQTIVPEQNQTINSTQEEINIPENNQTITPEQNQTTNSTEEEIIIPESNQTIIPEQNQTTNSTEEEISIPESNQTITPEQNQTTNSTEEEISIPESNQTIIPEQNQTTNSTQEQINTPENNQNTGSSSGGSSRSSSKKTISKEELNVKKEGTKSNDAIINELKTRGTSLNEIFNEDKKFIEEVVNKIKEENREKVSIITENSILVKEIGLLVGVAIKNNNDTDFNILLVLPEEDFLNKDFSGGEEKREEIEKVITTSQNEISTFSGAAVATATFVEENKLKESQDSNINKIEFNKISYVCEETCDMNMNDQIYKLIVYVDEGTELIIDSIYIK